MQLHANRPDNKASFQNRLFLLFTLFTIAVSMLFGTLYIITEVRGQKRDSAEQLQLLARVIADSIRLQLYAENIPALERIARESLELPHIDGVEISTGDGRLLVRLPETPLDDHARRIYKSADVRSLPFAALDELALEALEGEQKLVGTVRLYRDTEDLSRNAARLAWVVTVIAFMFWLLASFFGYLLLRRVTHSFNALMAGLAKVHAGDYHAKIEVLSDDEPGLASIAVNELSAALSMREEENRVLNASMKRSIEELKILLDHLPVGIIWSDNAGKVDYLNRFVTSRIGYSEEEVGSIETWLLLVSPSKEERERIVRERDRAVADWLERGEFTCYTINGICRDGSVCLLSCFVQMSGERIVDIIIDMTEHEQLQQELIRNQRLESLGVMAGGIAHNFNNVLTGVLGYISIAGKCVGDTHSAATYIASAVKALHRAAGLANQLLTFAKGGAPIKKPAFLPSLLEESVSLALSGSRSTCRMELPPSLHLVLADEGQICQAFSCICINAVQAMSDGGELTVSARNVTSATETLPLQLEGDFVEISFMDHGCGIAEVDKGKIFTPYFTRKAEIGSGLGLATVHSIVKRHGGGITFTSALDRGTTFTIYLPALKGSSDKHLPDKPAPEPRIVVKPQKVKKLVLLMDDEEIIREFARSMLEDDGYRVILAVSGEEAVSLYRNASLTGDPVAVAILDLTVPGGMGGEAAAMEILAFDPSARLIVSSGYSDHGVMVAYREYGFCAAVPKPYQGEDLLGLLVTVLALPGRR